MARLEDRQLSAGLHVVIPKTEFTGSAAYNPVYGAGSGPVAVSGPDNDTDAGVTGVVPHLAYVQELNDRWNFGLTVNVPFGLKTEYGADWVGRYSAIKSEITTVNLNPSLSFRVDEHASIGFGVSAMHANLTLKNKIDGGFPGSPGSADINGEIDVNDWGYGLNFGLLLEPSEHTRLGLAYRSTVEVKLDGDLTLSIPSSTSARVDASLPASLLLSAWHELNPQWAVMADIMWTQWSGIDALVARFGNGSSNTIPLHWEDSMRYSIGTSYKHDEKWTFRGGLAYDETPVTSPEFRPAALPDEDRLWVALGAGYQHSRNLSFDIGYAHLFIDDTRINSTDAYNSAAAPLTEGIHRLTGEYDSSVDIISAQANWKF